jgi:hypothetical protein
MAEIAAHGSVQPWRCFMSIPYHHTQRGTLMLAGLAGVGVLILIALVSALIAAHPPAAAVAPLAAASVALLALGWWFSSMTVDVTDAELRWHFGAGRDYRIARADIDGAQVARHPWWSGYGIRYRGPNRWTYIVGGRDVVEVRLKQGGWRRLGTDDPRGLVTALNSAAR